MVTGASSGIGRASARRLAAEGFEVICAARRTERVEELAAQIDGRAVTCDVTKADDVAALAREVGDRLDVLVANAGERSAPSRWSRPTSTSGERCTTPT
ncbi:hypothetical protein GCM10025872_03890 [Barrientosiimonas endolithica]|uniref:SDR family NAD(P)-dependent oxidoreductase n=1 Tax=Barrientosiimonas endolithica TaxID=1535208 RepID=A0ABM8H7A9_9MICO|nr:hypothetical protein GCM10025872_03890 [Barrientosiimonas endolithica]